MTSDGIGYGSQISGQGDVVLQNQCFIQSVFYHSSISADVAESAPGCPGGEGVLRKQRGPDDGGVMQIHVATVDGRDDFVI